ncbi:MAG: zincin-like metallopeptidase domain-containing protein [Pseudomonadota bacterium]
MAKRKERFDVHQAVTDQLVAALEAGTKPWKNGWIGGAGGGFPLRVTGEAYRGMNVLLLWCVAAEKGYRSPYWMTYRQAAELGAQVRKGEKSALVVKYGTFAKKDETGAVVTDENGDEQTRGYAKAYSVFNADQIDGLAETFHPETASIDTGAREIESAAAWFDATGAKIITSNRNPCFIPAMDEIHMPPIREFRSAEAYYSTLGHEATHWTGGKRRLAREFSRERSAYAIEELIAEIGACFIAAEIGIAPDIEDSAAYLASWLKALKDDKRFIFAAAGEAQKAVDYLKDRVAAASTEQEAA